MINIYLYYINLLTQTLSPSSQQIYVSNLESKTEIPIAVSSVSHEIPNKITKLVSGEKLDATNNYFAYIINTLSEENIDPHKIKLWEIIKPISHLKSKKGGLCNSKIHVTLQAPNKTFYSFTWKEKTVSNLSEIEQKIVSHYNVNKTSKVAFLYTYKKSKSPWAIKINDTVYPTMWVKGEVSTLKNNDQINKFLTFDSTNESKKIRLLIDSNQQVIAKRFNKDKPIFKID